MFKSNTVRVPSEFDEYFEARKKNDSLTKPKAFVELVSIALLHLKGCGEKEWKTVALACTNMVWHNVGKQVTLVDLVYAKMKDGSPSWEQIALLQERMNVHLEAIKSPLRIQFMLTFTVQLAYMGLAIWKGRQHGA